MDGAAVETACDQVRVGVDGAIAWIEFANPARANALTAGMFGAIPTVLEDLDAREEVRVIVVSGAGDRAFVSGADLSEMPDGSSTSDERQQRAQLAQRFWQSWEALDTPVISMIDGYCLGGGLALALRTDIRISSDRSTFGIPAVRLGRGYPVESVERLMRTVGPSWAAEMLLSGRRLSAEEAQRSGLVSRLVAVDDLVPAVSAIAADIAAGGPLAVQAARRAMQAVLTNADAAEQDRVSGLVAETLRSEDFQEGRRAFLERRRPVFRGR